MNLVRDTLHCAWCASAFSLVITVSACTLAPIAQPDLPVAGATSVEEILIPAGAFQMGCGPADDHCASHEYPLHEVVLDAFLIDKYEVTNARYLQCVQAGTCTPPHKASSATRDLYFGNAAYDDFPVVNVDWFQANIFCTWEGKRLPTEAEWEKAARGSTDTRTYPWGDEAPDCTRLNYYDETKGDQCIGDTTAVGAWPGGASPYGVMDMSGNVWEWVHDWHQADYYEVSPVDNPTGAESGDSRVLRGGSWLADAPFVRASVRVNASPEIWFVVEGIRCADSP